MAETKQKILDLVRQFIDINNRRREKELTESQIEHWYSLKHVIEEKLFARPPAKNDQRRYIRVQNLNLTVFFDSGIEEGEGIVKEVSEGGLFISTDDPLPPGTTLEVKISLPKGTGITDKEIILPVRVVYTNAGAKSFAGMGLMLSEKIKAPVQSDWRQIVNHFLEKAVDLEY